MAAIPGAVPVGGFFAPTDSTDVYPVTDPTWGLGGLRTVANLTERDAITTERREEGMAVYVISETKRYVLQGGITNAHWVHDFSGGVTELSDLTDVNTAGALEDQVLAYDAYTGVWTPATISAGASILADLSDVVTAGATQGQVLAYDSSTGTWSPTTVSASLVAALDDLTDVDTSGATEDQVLAYNSSTGTWTPATISSGISYIGDLLDVDASGATQNQVLSYDVSSATWRAATATAVGESYATEFSGTSISLIDGQDFILTESSLFTTRGIGQELLFTSVASSGQVTIELYQDSGRTEKVYEHVVDLSDSSTYKDYETFGFTNATTGTLYGTLSCSAVSGGSSCNIEVTASIISPTGSPTAAPSPYGDGIEDDGTGKPQVALLTQSGLAFSSGDLYVRGDNTQPVYTQRSANGLYVTGAVDTTTNQTIAGNKMFDSVGLTPSLSSGPPTSGTYSVGAEVLDVNNVKWRCYSSGSPGSWELADNVIEETSVYSTSTASIIYGNTVTVDLDVTGNAGNCLWFRVWARRASGTSSMQIPFRVRIYETTDYDGRDMVWQGDGLARQAPLSADLNPSIDQISADNDLIDVDEALVVYESDSRFEFGRCSNRLSSKIGLDEPLTDPYPWSSSTTSVLMVSEWSNVPWYNTDGNPDNRSKIFVEIRHDGQTGDPDLVFYVQALAMNMGVLR